MNYFIATNLGTQVSGIESAQLKRLQLFHERGLLATCVYTNYNTQLHTNADIFTIEDHCFSMYDFFQEAIDYPKKSSKNWLQYWEEECELRIEHLKTTNDIKLYTKKNEYLMYASFKESSYQTLVYINSFDAKGKVKQDNYDSRGFLSKTIYWGEDHQLLLEQFYTVNQQVAIIKYYEKKEENIRLRQIILPNYNNRPYRFEEEKELQVFFFNELYEEGDIFYSDRNRVLAEPLLKINPEIPLCAILHSVHAKNAKDVLTSEITAPYRYVFEQPERFHRIIVSTDQQRKELEERFPELTSIVTIPVGYTNPTFHEGIVKKKCQLLSVARYAEEKQLMHQLVLVNRLKEEFPMITLEMYGFGAEKQKLELFIRKNDLEKNVFLKGFEPDLSEVYQSSCLCLLTSRVEGFSLALLEAQSYGVPTISYNVRYGPREIIEDGLTGYLVEVNNQEELYRKVQSYLKNEEIQEAFSENCRILAKKYSKERVGLKWEKVVSEVINESMEGRDING